METTSKKEIQEHLRAYVAQFPSQNKAVDSLGGLVSGSYISQILNGKFDAISDEKFRAIGKKVGWVNTSWVFVDTTISTVIIEAFDSAKAKAVVNITPFLARAGSGKSETLDYLKKNYKEIVYVECKTLSPKSFLTALLNSAGKKANGMNAEALFDVLVNVLTRMESPVMIIDEINKASDKILLKIIDLYNALKYKCPIVTLSTPEFEKRITNGIEKEKVGYDEFFSRCSRKFYDLGMPTFVDVSKVCIANGISDTKVISDIVKKSNFDLRSVEEHVRMYFLKQNKAA